MSNEKVVKTSQLTNSIKQMSDYLKGKIDNNTTQLNNIANINTKVEYVTTQLDNMESKKLDKTGIVTMANMGQDIKEAMTGGSVAVVGKDAVLTENIVDKQVNYRKTNFMELDTSLNLFDGMYENIIVRGHGPLEAIKSNANAKTAVIKIKPNTTYSIIKDKQSRFNLGTATKLMNIETGENLDGSVIMPLGNSSKTWVTFTTGDNDEYLYVNVTIDGVDVFLQIVEGQQDHLTVDNYTLKFTKDVSVYSKDEINSLMEGTTKSNTFIKNGEVCDILLNNKVGYRLEHKTTSSINLNTWMLTKGTVGDVTLWSGTDIEAPIKEKGASDFIGGIHGDEIFETVEIVCDGVLLDLTQNYNITFKNLTVFVKSTLYRCETNTPAFTRYKKLEFVGDELLISNRLICLIDNFLIERYTGCGLYSVYKDLLLGYSVNTKPELIKDGEQGKNANMDIGTFYGEGFTITLKTISGKTDAYKGSVADFKNESRPRYKLYFDCINLYNGYKIDTNSELNTCFSIKIV